MSGAVRTILADNIRSSLKRSPITGVNALADLAGVSRSQMYDVLGRKKGASVDWIDKLATALKVEPSDLIRPRKVRAS